MRRSEPEVGERGYKGKRMKLTNPIGWPDATGNMVIGCDKVSPGCKNCYAADDTPARVLRAGKWPAAGRKVETWGAQGERWPVQAMEKVARRLNKLCICDRCRVTHQFGNLPGEGICSGSDNEPCGGPLRRIRLFADSNSDWLDAKWPIERLADLLCLIEECPNVDFLLLTKRPENWRERVDRVTAWKAAGPWNSHESEIREMARAWVEDGKAPTNVWLGVSVEDQRRAQERIPALLSIPAAVRFLSCEPLLEDLYLRCVVDEDNNSLDALTGDWGIEGRGHTGPSDQRINWVIVGGESDQPKSPARPCNVEWIRGLLHQCQSAGVACYVKQLGSHQVETPIGQQHHRLVGNAGTDPAKWPEDLRVRQFPKT